MSADTRAALDEAVRAHIADESGHVVIDWSLCAATAELEQMGDGVVTYRHDAPHNQPAHHSIGLLSTCVHLMQEDDT